MVLDTWNGNIQTLLRYFKNKLITVIDNKFYSEGKSITDGNKLSLIDVLDVENLKNFKRCRYNYHLAGITNVPTTIYDKSKNSNEIRQVGITGTKIS